MKVRELAWPMILLCCVVTACEEKPEGDAAGEQAGQAEDKQKATGGDMAAKPAADANAPAAAPKEVAPPTPPPAEVCTSLVNAIKAKDEAKVLALSTPGTAGALGGEGAKEHLMMALATANCGAAKVEGDNATVAVTAGEQSQDLAFVKAADGWKFDGAAYLTKYPPADKAEKGKGKGKGAKAKDHGKAKGKKHKK